MIFPFLTSRRRQTTIRGLYGAIVAQARKPSFYLDFGVQDTVNGRFDMIVLHLSLLLRRTEDDPQLRRLGQDVFDRFCADLDDHFREEGVGDLRVPKEMQKLAEAFYGRHHAYRDALASADRGALVSAIIRNIYPEEPGGATEAVRLAHYVRAAASGLERQKGLAEGELDWPEPDSFGRRSSGRREQGVMAAPQPIWTATISFDDVPEHGSHVHLVADEQTRGDLARATGLRDISRLEASFDITRHGGRALRIVGDVSASISQTCVVTLEPVENEVHENFNLLFTKSTDASIADEDGQATVRFGDADVAEPMHAGTVDIGAVATEFFLLGIDPYPRKEGAVFEAPRPPENPSDHPFAALAALKKGKTGRPR